MLKLNERAQQTRTVYYIIIYYTFVYSRHSIQAIICSSKPYIGKLNYMQAKTNL